MTLRRVNRGTWHQYLDDDQELPGVTTVINQALAKPALVYWAANVCGDYVLDHWDELVAMEPSQRGKAVSKASERKSRTAMDRGTRIHTLGEQLVHGQPVDIPDDLDGPVQAYARWLDTWHVVPHFTEAVVASRRWGYAGTLDLIGTDVMGGVFLGDLKSGKDVYDDTALQLAAYRYADTMLADGEELPMPEVDRCQVIHVMPDTVRVVPMEAGPAEFRTFLYLLETFRWIRHRKDVPARGMPMDAPPTPPRLEVVQ